MANRLKAAFFHYALALPDMLLILIPEKLYSTQDRCNFGISEGTECLALYILTKIYQEVDILHPPLSSFYPFQDLKYP